MLIQLPSFVVGTLFGGFIGFAGFVDVNGRFVMPAVWDEKTIAIASIGGVLAIATLVVSIWTQMATMVAIKDLDTVLSFREAYKQSSGLILSSLVISILTGLALMGGFILLVIPGIIFLVWFSFGNYVLVNEGKKGSEALQASKEYVKGNFWAVLGRYIVLILVAIVVFAVPSGILSMTGLKILEDVYTTVASLFFSPLAVIYTFLMYRSLRDMKLTPTLHSV